jgi:isoleucyl-tRNA synthetase
VILDTTVTPELADEGLARDVIRWIQQERKTVGLDVSDRIDTVISGDDDARRAIATHRDMVAAETLSLSLELEDLEGSADVLSVGENSKIRVKVSKSG